MLCQSKRLNDRLGWGIIINWLIIILNINKVTKTAKTITIVVNIIADWI